MLNSQIQKKYLNPKRLFIWQQQISWYLLEVTTTILDGVVKLTKFNSILETDHSDKEKTLIILKISLNSNLE